MRNAIFSSYQPGGMFAVIDVNKHPGNVWFVNSVTGINGDGYGQNPDAPFAGLDYAVGKCTANNGDVIYVMPGHNEGIIAVAAIDFDVAGITVIGLGTGSLKPTIDYDHADASVAIGADNVCIKGFRFRVSANAVTNGIVIEAGAKGYEITENEFGWAETATDEFAIGIQIMAGCNDGLIEKNFFAAAAQAAVHAIKLNGASDNIIIRNNRFTGVYSTACVGGITTLSTNLLIEKNLFYQGASEPAIELLTGTTGVIRDNDIKTNLATMAAAIVADGCFYFRNYYNEDAAGTGAVIGVASADD